MKKHTRDCITLFIVILSFFVLFSLFYTRSEGEMAKMKESSMVSISNQLKSNFDTARIYAELGATFVTGDPNIVKIVEQAYTLHNSKNKKNKDINPEKELKKLRQDFKDKYKHMVINDSSDYGIVQSHFHIVNENNMKKPFSLIRFHKDEKINFDEKTDYLFFRKMIVDLHEQQDSNQLKPRSGIELGIAGMGIRGLSPIINKKGKLIGSFEFGFNHMEIIEKIEKSTNSNIRILLDKKAFEDKKILLDTTLALAIPGMLYLNSNIKTDKLICNDTKCSDVLNSDLFGENLKKIRKEKNKEAYEYFSVKNHDVYLAPFYDMHKVKIGALLIMKKMEGAMNE